MSCVRFGWLAAVGLAAGCVEDDARLTQATDRGEVAEESAPTEEPAQDGAALPGRAFDAAAAAVVPLTSTVTTIRDPWPVVRAEPYFAHNNAWGTRHGIPAGWSQSVGIAAQAAGSVGCRFRWNYPVAGRMEISAFPSCVIGRTSGNASAPQMFPSRLSQISNLTTAHTAITGATPTGYGHMSYDLWLSRSGGTAVADRLVEVMVPVYQVRGYGNFATRNPAVKTNLTLTVDGVIYDVCHGAPGVWGNPWRFVVFQPRSTGPAGRAIRWQPFFDFMRRQGWVSGDPYLNGVELGYEVASIVNRASVASSGDLSLEGFKVTATIRR